MFTRRKFTKRNSNGFWSGLRQSRRWLVLLALTLTWSAIGGGLLARLAAAPVPAPPAAAATVATPYVTTDAVADRYQLGQQLYFENCATCHIGLPPAVMPTETWRDILRDRSHYGATLPQLPDATRKVMGQYLQIFSRSKSPQEEQIPYRLAQSLYFKALHPGVSFTKSGVKPGLNSCEVCHPASRQFNFRQIKSES
jgi:mono/diheme cytochrome c family protein